MCVCTLCMYMDLCLFFMLARLCFIVYVRLQLIDDKKSLSVKCEQLVQELKNVDKKYQDKIKTLEDKSVLTRSS